MRKYTIISQEDDRVTIKGVVNEGDTASVNITIQMNPSQVDVSERKALVKKVLSTINEPYFLKKGLLEDNQQNFDWGVITTEQYNERLANINAILP